MIVYGITGGMGAGKSAVTNIIKEHGFTVLDADEIAREVESKDSPLLRILVKEFGIEIIAEDGNLDRRKLAEIAFADQEKTNRLNDLVQTAVFVNASVKIRMHEINGSQQKMLFFDVPMLFEAGWDRFCEQVWVVTAPEETRIERVAARDGLSFDEIKQRISLQLSDAEKIERADVVINNSGNYDQLRAQVEELLKDL